VEVAVLKITRDRHFSDEQQTWLAYIKEHLIENLAIAEADFDLLPVFERHGGLGRARQIFGKDLAPLIREMNEALAA
jgi:type I restriction enzyme R subunit